MIKEEQARTLRWLGQREGSVLHTIALILSDAQTAVLFTLQDVPRVLCSLRGDAGRRRENAIPKAQTPLACTNKRRLRGNLINVCKSLKGRPQEGAARWC